MTDYKDVCDNCGREFAPEPGHPLETCPKCGNSMVAGGKRKKNKKNRKKK